MLIGVAGLACYSALRFALAGIANLCGLTPHSPLGSGATGLRQLTSCDCISSGSGRVARSAYHERSGAGGSAAEISPFTIWSSSPITTKSPAVLRRSLDRLAEQADARTSITVVLAMEAAEPGARQKGEQLGAEYRAAFAHVFVTVHPPGEMQCKSANLNWALRWAKHNMVDDLGYNLDHLVVTTMDADTLWHPRYFESLRVLFATDPQRYATYWQAPIRYHGNVWEAHPLMRILHAYASAWELAYLAAPWWRALPMSSYSASLRLLHERRILRPGRDRGRVAHGDQILFCASVAINGCSRFFCPSWRAPPRARRGTPRSKPVITRPSGTPGELKRSVTRSRRCASIPARRGGCWCAWHMITCWPGRVG